MIPIVPSMLAISLASVVQDHGSALGLFLRRGGLTAVSLPGATTQLCRWFLISPPDPTSSSNARLTDIPVSHHEFSVSLENDLPQNLNAATTVAQKS
jgi:hypothetical protein